MKGTEPSLSAPAPEARTTAARTPAARAARAKAALAPTAAAMPALSPDEAEQSALPGAGEPFRARDWQRWIEVLGWTADLVALLDTRGRIVQAIGQAEGLEAAEVHAWKGRTLDELITEESRPKLLALLADARRLAPLAQVPRMPGDGIDAAGAPVEAGSDAAAAAPATWRQLNLHRKQGPLAITFSARRLREDGSVLVLGRSMAHMMRLQQQFVQSQRQIAQEFGRLRDLEARFRLLFQNSEDPLILIEASSMRVVDANAAARDGLGLRHKRLGPQRLSGVIDAKGLRTIREQIEQIRGTGHSEIARVRHARSPEEYLATMQPLHQDGHLQVLLRLSALRDQGTQPAQAVRQAAAWFAASADALVLCDAEGRIEQANPAFLELVRMTHESRLRGESLARWLGRGVVDLDVLLSGLRQSRRIRHYTTAITSELASPVESEISGAVLQEEGDLLGLSIRPVAARTAPGAQGSPAMSRSVEQLSELVGSVSLRDLVRESTDVIERMCIEAALSMTRDNRASAAEMLGLSRQSLYTKMRRFGLAAYDNPATED